MQNIAVIFGGISVEHEISVITGVQTANALDRKKYNIIPIYISKNGKFYYSPSFFDIKIFTNLQSIKDIATQVCFNGFDNMLLKVKRNKCKNFKLIDVCLMATHGGSGENGSLCGLLDMCKIPYTCSNVLGSAICTNKYFAKKILKNVGVEVVEDFLLTNFHKSMGEDFCTKEVLKVLKFPLVVKPCSLGSSVGVSVCKSKAALKKAISFAFMFDEEVLVENYVQNLCEVNISVLGGSDKQEISVCESPQANKDFLSYQDKYISNAQKSGMAGSQREIPKKLDPITLNTIKDYALMAFKVLKLKGVVRIDFLIDQSLNKVYLNEINTIPGSLSFYLWEVDKYKFAKLLDKLVDVALLENNKESKKLKNFETSVLNNFASTPKLKIGGKKI